MSYSYYLGRNVSAIAGMEYDGYGEDYSKRESKELLKLINEPKSKFTLAITANKWQKAALNTLKNNGFKEEVTFQSSHNDISETLTLWVKVNKDIKVAPKIKKENPTANCSVTYHKRTNERFNITTSDSKKSLPKGFVRVKNTPIYFAVKKEHIVK